MKSVVQFLKSAFEELETGELITGKLRSRASLDRHGCVAPVDEDFSAVHKAARVGGQE